MPRFRFVAVLAIVPSVIGENVRLRADQAVTATSSGDQLAKREAIPAQAFVRRILGLADVVMANHVEPPTRQQMILVAARALVAPGGQPTAAQLSERISRLAADADLERLLTEVWNQTREGDRSDAERQAGAIEAVCRTVPGQPNLISAAERRVQQQISANRYVGIGVQIAMHPSERLATIVNPLPRGAARKAGARPGDLIIDVDGVQTEGRSLEDVVRMLRGESGTRVEVTVRQPSSQESRKLDMTRAEVPFESVLGYRRLDDDSWDFRVDPAMPVGYVRIVSITASTPHELRQAARSIADQDARGLIVDLRNHAGSATLEHFQFVADELLDDRPIGRLRDASGQTHEFLSGPDSLFSKLPIVVLANRYTRGDPEFLIAALQDAGRATIVGEPTPGDAYVRRLVDLPDGLGSIVLRSAVWERPSGQPLLRPDSDSDDFADRTPIEHVDPDRPWGVRPDHVVKMSEQQLREWIAWRTGEDIADASPAQKAPQSADPQLDKAIELVLQMADAN